MTKEHLIQKPTRGHAVPRPKKGRESLIQGQRVASQGAGQTRMVSNQHQMVEPRPSFSTAEPVLTPKRTPTMEAVVHLVKEIQDGRVDPRTLPPKHRRAVLAILADGSFSNSDLAAIMKCTRKKIEGDLTKIRKELGASVTSWTTAEAVGYLYASADRCSAFAMSKGDAGLANAIRSNFVRQLKELGVIGPKDAREGNRITIEVMGEGLTRATEALERAFDPLLSGERVDARLVEGRRVDDGAPRLMLPTTQPHDNLADVEVSEAD